MIRGMKVALHICCAVCAAGAAERLIKEGYQLEGFFYNPNLYPEAEYFRRLENAHQTAANLSFPLYAGEYIPADWEKAVAGWENEPEGGRRCWQCFGLRLSATYQFMLKTGCDRFATTLSMGSNKSARLIERLAVEIGGEAFLSRNFKSKEGFKRATELARQWGLYRQNYCGCRFSLRDLELRRKPVNNPDD
ncbi:MAG TPA: epoxyqueuosine reductase QueH [Dehalococcoidales bacterium]|nr:epoxyqueuosine reductase QueH [Dehalococcoidales bacterium]